MRFLIAGFGSIGRRHLRNLRELGEHDILLLRSGHSTLPPEEIAGLPVETTMEAALAHQPDAVIVANPTALHLETAIPAALAGCHLFLEKPVAANLSRVNELRRALSTGGGKALVGFQFRWHPGLRQVKDWLLAGAAGKPAAARALWGEYLPDWHPWENYRQGYAARRDLGGGVVRTLSHPLDYLRWLMGEVETIHSFTGTLSQLDLDVEDTAEISLQFTGGALGSVHLNYMQRPPVHRLEVICTEGTILWDNADGAARLFNAGQGGWEVVPPPAGFERNSMFLAELQNFIEVVKGVAEPVCTLEDGIRVQEMVEQIQPV